MADGIVSVFVEKLVNALADQGRVIFEFQEQFERMKTQLQFMQSFLKDADRRKRKNETLCKVMDGLRELIYDAEDILAECEIRVQLRETEISKGGWSMHFSPSELPFRSRTGNRLEEINKRIGQIKEDMRSFLMPAINGGQISAPEEEQRWSSPVWDENQIVGLEEDAMKIKGWLFQANDYGLTTIGIVGMGGLGKTTAAQKVYNDRQVEDHFDRRMWVSVSQTFTEEEIMRSMLRTLGDVSMGDSPGELLHKIHQYLLGKSYLIVMDDVWSLENGWWTRLCNGLPKKNGSSIIITTRNEDIARKMGVVEARFHRPKFLTQEQSWSLFCKIAFPSNRGECNYTGLEDVGREMVGKCGGLPLAIKAIGGIMRCKRPSLVEWKRIADNFSDELAAENNDSVVGASLQLSYDELPAYLKSCFLCFAVYPEDCTISKDQLIRWWFAEGFVPERNGRLAIESGEDCFTGLVNRCLVEAVDKSYSGKINTCKIHDLVRDLVIRIAKKEAFCTPEGVPSRRLSLKSSNCVKSRSISKLRALLSTTKTGETNILSSSIAKKFCECQYLRVLDVSRSVFETHLNEVFCLVGSLKHLRYLSLRHTHPIVHFPHSMEKLKNLRILDVSYCHNLRTLPPYITALEKLTILDVSNCGSLKYIPKGLGKLSNLQVLIGFRPSKSSCLDGCRFAELKSMTQLKILGLRITQGEEIGDDEMDTLSHLRQLQFLTIDCIDSYSNDLGMKLDRLSVPQQLHELSLKFFPGELSPTWLNPTSLPHLQYLSISSGNLAHMNSLFWGNERTVWKIESLMLESLSSLEEDWTRVSLAMPSVKLLSISWCPKLRSFPVEDFGFRGGMWRK